MEAATCPFKQPHVKMIQLVKQYFSWSNLISLYISSVLPTQTVASNLFCVKEDRADHHKHIFDVLPRLCATIVDKSIHATQFNH